MNVKRWLTFMQDMEQQGASYTDMLTATNWLNYLILTGKEGPQLVPANVKGIQIDYNYPRSAPAETKEELNKLLDDEELRVLSPEEVERSNEIAIQALGRFQSSDGYIRNAEDRRDAFVEIYRCLRQEFPDARIPRYVMGLAGNRLSIRISETNFVVIFDPHNTLA